MEINTEEPPLYSIDLSLPPQSRYTTICNDFKHEISEMTGIYDDILDSTPYPRLLGFLATLLLRRVHSHEETAEIRGIAQATGVPLNLVVAYNTFLDLFSGCISGGVKAKDVGGIVHFRGLDWGMDPLRDLIIRVEYVRDGKVVARGVTYAGYVGCLTGVREGLSMSLNYRANINSKSSIFSHRQHQLSLLLGRTPAIASHLRQILLSPGPPATLDQLASKFTTLHASTSYLTFCTPKAVLVIEKDLKTATIHTSDKFLAVTNHDASMESWDPERWAQVPELACVRDIVNDSIQRKECVANLFQRQRAVRVTVDTVRQWLRTYPLRNEMTHFSCIMDPSAEGGGLLWVEACEES